MKVWSVPVMLPDPEKEPEQTRAAMRFLRMMKGLEGFCPHESGNTLIVFSSIESARAAKWKLEEFTEAPLAIIEGTLSADRKKLNCTRRVYDC